MNKKFTIIIFILLAVVIVGITTISYFGKTVSLKNNPIVNAGAVLGNQNSASTTSDMMVDENWLKNVLIGQKCENGGQRPIAVMLAADQKARPLYGISKADLVVEMPVLTDGITRYMALFSCEEPAEIGAMRSARHDFLPFAKSFDAIYAHWGGSYLALDLLNKKVMDNLDALKNPFDAFYRKSGRLAPHNGFTSFPALKNAIEKFGYRNENKAGGYIHIKDEPILNSDQNIFIAYPDPYNADFYYNRSSNSYFRSRGGQKEIDSENGKQVEVKNLIIIIANSRQINADYNEMEIEGEGNLIIYRNGEAIKGKWKRKKEMYAGKEPSAEDRYIFLNENSQEIGMVPGKIWISVVQPNQRVEQTFR